MSWHSSSVRPFRSPNRTFKRLRGMKLANASAQNTKHRLLIVDDHPLVRSGIRAILQLEPDLEVCGEAETQEQALEIVERDHPQLVLVDITLKNSSGLTLLKELQTRYPDILTLAVSMHDEYTYAVRCLKAGAKGYIMKQAGTERIRDAIRCVLEGGTYLSEKMTQSAVEQLGTGRAPGVASPVEVLSNRELELFQLTGQGKEIAEIAEIMQISPRTVEVHRSHIKKKLGLRTSTDIFQAAYEWLRQSGIQP